MIKKLNKEDLKFLNDMENYKENNLKILAYPIGRTFEIVWECKKCNTKHYTHFGNAFRKGIKRLCKTCGKQSSQYDINSASKIFKDRGYKLLEKEYINCKTKMKYWCPKCETEQSMSLDNMKRGKGCPSCANISMKVDKVIIEKVKKLGFEFINIERDVKKDVSDNININLKCNKGHFFKVNWVTLRNKEQYECKVCRGYQATREGKTKEEIFKEVNNYIDDNNLDYKLKDCRRFEYNSKYNRKFIKLIIECPKHGEYEVEKYQFLNGGECQKCMSERFALSIDEVKSRLYSMYGDKYKFISKKYGRKKDKYLFEHKDCGKIFEACLDSLLAGDSSCPYCSNGGSKGEYYLKEFFNKNNIKYKPQYRISECKDINTLPFDFAIFDENKNLKFLIEVDSRIHKEYIPFIHRNYENFIDKQKKDKIKEDYCKNNNIKLYKPYYHKINDIKQWIKENKNLFI